MLDAPAPSGSEEEDDEESVSSDSDAESADSEDEAQLNGDLQAATTTSTSQDADADSPTTEPSFGDLLRARAPTTITVEPTSTTALNTLTAPNSRTLTIPTATSLGTVLTQALRTNDIDLLESCLQVSNLDSIRATIERLHSSLATTLLHKLAERLHRRPGRAGSLMVWVQWTIVAHGGYLASQPASVKQLHTLYNVVKQRAAGLQPLLTLKGKLDMLEAQMRLRQSMQERVRPGTVRDQDEAGVVYVEGEEDVVAVNGIDDDAICDIEGDSESEGDDEDSEVDELAAIAPALAARAQKKKLQALDIATTIPESDDEGDEDDMPDTLPNGVDGHDDDEGSSDDDDDAEGLLDDEAEESGEGGSEDSELDEEDIDYDDEDLIDDESSEGEEEEERPAVVPVKAVTSKQRKGSKRK